MSVMEDVFLNAKSAVSSVGKKAGRVIDRSKLRLAAIDIRSELSKKYRLLGKLCYESARNGKNYDRDMNKLYDSISELNTQLDAVNEMLASAEKKIKCPECGVYNRRDALFCSQCGTKLSSEDTDSEEEEEILDFEEEMADDDA